MVHVAGAEEMTRSLREIAEIAYGEPARLPPGIESGLEAQYRYDPPPMTFTSAAHACIVEVDADTGFVKIKRWMSCEDCGTIINPAVVEGQIAGGLDAGDRHGAARGGRLRRARQSDRGDVQGLSAAGDFRRSGFRVSPRLHAVASPKAAFAAWARAARSSARRRWSMPSPMRSSPFGEMPIDLPLTPAKILDVIEGRPIASKVAATETAHCSAAAEQCERSTARARARP